MSKLLQITRDRTSSLRFKMVSSRHYLTSKSTTQNLSSNHFSLLENIRLDSLQFQSFFRWNIHKENVRHANSCFLCNSSRGRTPSYPPAGNSNRQSTRTAWPVLVLVARILPSSMMTSASRGHQLPGPSCIMRLVTYRAHGAKASQVWGRSVSRLWFCPRWHPWSPWFKSKIWKMPNTSSII